MNTSQRRNVFLFLVAVAVSTVAAHAQSGCVDSPENPTAVLGLVGAGGAALAYVRAKISERK
jgi:XrtJ-associated TM-motif-TM protein